MKRPGLLKKLSGFFRCDSAAIMAALFQRKGTTMDFETAMESTVSVNSAIAELARHGHKAVDFDDCELFDCTSGEAIAAINGGCVSGGAVLAWLGY